MRRVITSVALALGLLLAGLGAVAQISPGTLSVTSAQIISALGYTPATNALASGHIFVGNGSNVATDVAMSQDCVLTNAGLITCNGFSRRLGRATGANFNSTVDQAITIAANVTKYLVTAIYVTNCSANLTTAVGGFYTAAGKSGVTLVAGAQAYTALTGATVLLPTTLAAAANTTSLTGGSVFLSLTLAQGAPATCDVYVFGADLT